jgi:hypothetical protein
MGGREVPPKRRAPGPAGPAKWAMVGRWRAKTASFLSSLGATTRGKCLPFNGLGATRQRRKKSAKPKRVVERL